MQLINLEEFERYIKDNYEFIHESDSSSVYEELSGTCDSCRKEVFLKVYSEEFSNPYQSYEYPRFVNIFFECPACRRKSYLQVVQFREQHAIKNGNSTKYHYTYRIYKLFRLPTSNEKYVNEDIPNKYVSLKKSAIEADYCLKNGKFLASSILYRRAIQILAKQVLGAKGNTLYNQLEWLKTNKNSLGLSLSEVFHDNSKIIKDIGNQGAHPDNDITLHEFTKEDAYGLHDLFISIIHEIFIKPAKLKSLQEELRNSRKLK